MDQNDVATFNDDHDMELAPSDRILDLTAEVGELSKAALAASEYGETAVEPTPELVDELGDVYYCLLSLAVELDVDAEAALAASVEKYRDRLSESGDPGSKA